MNEGSGFRRLFFFGFGLGAGAFLEQFLGRDLGFLGVGLLRQHVLAARLALGFVLAAGHVHGDVHLHFGMQHHRQGEQADRLDRHADVDLVTVDLEAGLLHRVRDIARRDGAIELATVAGLADQGELLAVELLADLFGFALQLQNVGTIQSCGHIPKQWIL